MRFAILFLALTVPGFGQWTLQESHTTASLRGIHSLGNGVAWASGTHGTVLRTVDGGKDWETCAVPEGAEKLDFRGVQGFTAASAIVMSSGKGELSRLYETNDGCKTWKLIRTNDEPEGFWDALAYTAPANPGMSRDSAVLVGDPVRGCFQAYTLVGSDIWWVQCNRPSDAAPIARTGESAFAASNSAALSFGRGDYMLGTGGTGGARVIFFRSKLFPGSKDEVYMATQTSEVPIGAKTESSGIFSLAMKDRMQILAVGGDYLKANDSAGTAAWTSDGGKHWQAAATLPHGYRSAVAYDAANKAWVTVGPNGTDVSMDDGRNWRPLTPGAGDAADSDKHWNALSLPFVVGEHGRIGVLRDGVLVP
jgi:hypothetical protein